MPWMNPKLKETSTLPFCFLPLGPYSKAFIPYFFQGNNSRYKLFIACWVSEFQAAQMCRPSQISRKHDWRWLKILSPEAHCIWTAEEDMDIALLGICFMELFKNDQANLMAFYNFPKPYSSEKLHKHFRAHICRFKLWSVFSNESNQPTKKNKASQISFITVIMWRTY